MMEKRRRTNSRQLLRSLLPCLLGLTLMAASCNGKKKDGGEAAATQTVSEPIETPFSADSAYAFVERQVAFGPRVPGSEAHRRCADYLAGALRDFGLDVIEQRMTLEAYDGTTFDGVNIIGQYRPEAEERLLLFAHWDSRPFADNDPDQANWHTPIDGANDGASGVGVLLEIARLLQAEGLRDGLGIDIIFFDAEDYGVPRFESYDGNSEETWGLGAQYWAKNPHRSDYRAELGILLDMVGGEDAAFYREYFSQQSAGRAVTELWQTAEELGHGDYFHNALGGGLVDDHVFVIRHRRIPCLDIVDYDPERGEGFPDVWHTVDDTMEHIDPATLEAVGSTLWTVLTRR
jgi:hypothetical protein